MTMHIGLNGGSIWIIESVDSFRPFRFASPSGGALPGTYCFDCVASISPPFLGIETRDFRVRVITNIERYRRLLLENEFENYPNGFSFESYISYGGWYQLYSGLTHYVD